MAIQLRTIGDAVKADHYKTSLEHILAELERVDLLIWVNVVRARQLQVTDAEFQGLYISDQEIDALLARPTGMPRWVSDPDSMHVDEAMTALEGMAAEIERRKAISLRKGVHLRLDELSRLFHLERSELDILLIGLAPELDLRFERVYAYLQDDVTKKRPSVDLALNLLCTSLVSKIATRQSLTPGARLLKHQLLTLFEDPVHHQPPLLSRYIKVDDRVVNYLLESDALDPRLLPFVRRITPRSELEDLLLPDGIPNKLARIAEGNTEAKDLVFYFQGPYGVGKQNTAEAFSHHVGLNMLKVNGAKLIRADELDFEKAVTLISREALLQKAGVYWEGFDVLLTEEKEIWREIFLRELEERGGLTFLAGEKTWEPARPLHAKLFLRIEFPIPSYSERAELWARHLDGDMPREKEMLLLDLASKFRFSGGQINNAVVTARNLAYLRDPGAARITPRDIYLASRLHSNQKLASLAKRIIPNYVWEDIVLPKDQLRQLREICHYVKYRALVFDEWGFEKKFSIGKGLNALFAGPSGTGKTMAAEIIAGELGLDLYKIDLSTVISKYIGETEKNLARIFTEAETSNAILFFDEADALFGKRSEVKDSHDRYANIEISYLLQKMEEYEGVTILATNLSKNMDEAFVRRIAFKVNFPFPEEEDRLRIWEKIWPSETPREEGLDLGFMARQFKLAGGNIKNIAFAAVFLAAADGQSVTMDHLVWATKREFQKMGKVCVRADFGPYYSLIEDH